MSKKAFLIILDGWGHGPDPVVSAIAQANTPFIDHLYENYPNAELVTYGSEVGLPEGQMGNSEVGHLNIGAGRIVYQELARINKEIQENILKDQGTIEDMAEYAIRNNKPVHLLGLLSDGGVHSHINHTIYLANMLTSKGIQVYIHAFLDGRDTDPNGGAEYISQLLEQTDNELCKLSTIVGRYYAMDRDKRWERIKKAYDLLVNGIGEASNDPVKAVKSYYAKEITDEFMEPIRIDHGHEGLIKDGDVVFFTNFRTDRPRQLTEVLTQSDNHEFNMHRLDTYYVTMTSYDDEFSGLHIVFTKDNIVNTIGEIIANEGLTQLRIAETEKYPHVTFFFSGGEEKTFENESRILVNSPKVPTYDLQPEMSAYEITSAVQKFIKSDQPDFIILNYANADMVGHTGVFNAAIQAAETLDSCMESLIPFAIDHNYRIMIIADHGNSDCMINPDGSPHTAHTMNPVPVIVIDPDNEYKTVKNGKLADIAPTILSFMNIDIPKDMTGNNIALKE
ncbi:MAG: 2,3-bisphosphoglycerate-independent phosphoglycerate mutase [Saprospiraceae bacterium]|nr:2,3-bisphosphoglycerate-independent phosphoglycerate mutase [Saprospiraceae bacterium]